MDTPSTGIPKPARLPNTPVSPFLSTAAWDLYKAALQLLAALDDPVDPNNTLAIDAAVLALRAAVKKAHGPYE